MKKATEVIGKFIFVIGFLGIAYGIFSQEKMTTIYSIYVMILGFFILSIVFNNYKNERSKNFIEALLTFFSL
jgi:uncharacterized membrane protein